MPLYRILDKVFIYIFCQIFFINPLAMREKHALLMDARVSHEMEIEAYYNIEKRIQQLQQSIKSKILKPSKVVPFFQPGRLLKVLNILRN